MHFWSPLISRIWLSTLYQFSIIPITGLQDKCYYAITLCAYKENTVPESLIILLHILQMVVSHSKAHDHSLCHIASQRKFLCRIWWDVARECCQLSLLVVHPLLECNPLHIIYKNFTKLALSRDLFKETSWRLSCDSHILLKATMSLVTDNK